MCGAVDISLAEVKGRGEVCAASVLRALQGIAWPHGARSGAPAARTASGIRPRLQLGMAISRATGPCLSLHTRKRPRLTKMLTAYVRQHMPDLPFASLALAHSSEAGAHEDPNTCQSAVTALGPFTGGGLWTYSVAADVIRTHRVKKQFCLFNAREPHGTCAFAGGPRYTITAYMHVRARAVKVPLARKLRSLGFALPARSLAQALPGTPPATQQERLTKALAAWRRHCGRGRGQKNVTQPHRAPGEHRASVWVCRVCGASGEQHAGRPRVICRKKACERAANRAYRAGG